MSLNIKSPEAHDLARELAEMTGESMTTAAIEAMRERRERLTAEPPESIASELMDIGRSCAARIKTSGKDLDHDKLLYDEDGLPK